MRYLISTIFLFACCATYGQLILKDSTESKLILGIHPNLLYSSDLVDEQSNKFAKLFSFSPRTYFAYNLYRNFYVGGNFSYEIFLSNFYKKRSFAEIGCFARYTLPYTINRKVLKLMHLHFEVGYNQTNYKHVPYIANTFEYKNIIIEEDFIISKELKHSKVSIPIGITLQVVNHIFIDLDWQKNFYINGSSKSGFMCGVGFNF